jgi:undecaprenyl-diphosphatase
MQNLLAALMGLVEGLTEFLPISSTGHLVLAGNLSGFDAEVGKEMANAFKIVIQLGAILAIVAVYPGRFTRLLQFGDNRGLSGFRGLGLLAITSLPAAVLGLLAHHRIEALFQDRAVVAALAVGAVWILAVENYRPRVKVEGLDSLTWKDALNVGLFQCLSLWPGMSRSACTILGGMMTGVERKTATEYSFLAAVPIMTAATLFEFYKKHALILAGNKTVFAVGFVVSFVSAWLAVKVFLRFVGNHTLTPFGWYRLAAAATALAWLRMSGQL